MSRSTRTGTHASDITILIAFQFLIWPLSARRSCRVAKMTLVRNHDHQTSASICGTSTQQARFTSHLGTLLTNISIAPQQKSCEFHLETLKAFNFYFRRALTPLWARHNGCLVLCLSTTPHPYIPMRTRTCGHTDLCQIDMPCERLPKNQLASSIMHSTVNSPCASQVPGGDGELHSDVRPGCG